MNDNEINQLADLWIAKWETGGQFERTADAAESFEKIDELALDGEHAILWKFVLAAYDKNMSSRVFGALAAGPLEDLLTYFGPIYIDRIKILARRDPKFNELLGGVWKNAMSDEVWDRITSIRNKVW